MSIKDDLCICFLSYFTLFPSGKSQEPELGGHLTAMQQPASYACEPPSSLLLRVSVLPRLNLLQRKHQVYQADTDLTRASDALQESHWANLI